MLGIGAVSPPAIAALVSGDPLAAVEYLDHPGCRADIDLLADEPVGHGIEELFELDGIIGGDAGQSPFGELVILRRQAGQGRLFHGLEQMTTADAEAAHDMVVDPVERPGDRCIGIGQREEGLPPQSSEDAGLGEPNPVLDLRLVLRAPWPGRQHADTVMGSHHAVAAVDLRIVEGGTVDAGLQIVGHD